MYKSRTFAFQFPTSEQRVDDIDHKTVNWGAER